MIRLKRQSMLTMNSMDVNKMRRQEKSIAENELSRQTNVSDLNKRKGHAWIWVCFLAYLFALFYVLFFAEAFGRTGKMEEYRYNLTLFQEIGRYYRLGMRGSWTLFVVNIVGNIVVFVPFGAFMPILFPKCKNMLLTTLLSLEFSLIIEVIQLVCRVGSFDVDDLLLNTIGGVCGWCVFCGIFLKRKTKNHKA